MVFWEEHKKQKEKNISEIVEKQIKKDAYSTT